MVESERPKNEPHLKRDSDVWEWYQVHCETRLRLAESMEYKAILKLKDQ